MRVWRIAKQRYALDRNGSDGLMDGGRWHCRGTPVIYAGLTVEICAMEKLVHTGSILPADLVLVSISIPDEPELYEEIAGPGLPQGWDATPPGASSIDAGMDFLRSGRAMGLIVPSSVVPEARNMIINPLHPRFGEATLSIGRRFVFDARLLPPQA